MKIIFVMLLAAVLAGLSLAGCDEKPEIQQSFPFRVETLPVPKKLAKGQTAEIRCTLVREGNYTGTRYSFRYFQPDGKGALRISYGDMAPPPIELLKLPVLVSNDLYDLEQDKFRMYYTSQSDDQQTVDIYFFDSFGKEYVLNFKFNNSSDKTF